jgi:hypothetical protein
LAETPLISYLQPSIEKPSSRISPAAKLSLTRDFKIIEAKWEEENHVSYENSPDSLCAQRRLLASRYGACAILCGDAQRRRH